MGNILNAVLVLGGAGLFFGLLLAFGAKLFETSQDENISQITEKLPGTNCGGCGFGGCALFAAAVAEGSAKTNGCCVGGDATSKEISEIMGVSAEKVERRVAKIKCAGTKDVAHHKFTYEGINDCVAANKLMGGDKICSYACLGLGTCANVCEFDAITIKNGIAYIDEKKCTACGKCVEVCPKKAIEITQAKQTAFVMCNSKNKGAVVRQICDIGCIGCKICEKTCKNGAITVENNLAKINEEKCNNCGECISKCPRRVIE